MFKRPCAHSRLLTTPWDRSALTSAVFFFILVLISMLPCPAVADSKAGDNVVSSNSDNPNVALNELALTEPAARFPTLQKPTTPLVVNISVNTISKGDFFVEIDNEGSLYFRVEDILGLKLKSLRREQGMPLKAVAARSGLSVSYLSEIEKGKKYPKPEKLILIARALDVSFDDFVSVEVDESLDPGVRGGVEALAQHQPPGLLAFMIQSGKAKGENQEAVALVKKVAGFLVKREGFPGIY